MHRMILIVVLTLLSGSVFAERIKDLTHIAGVRTNQLVGYGLVVGLDGSGDQTSQTPFTVQSLQNMLQQFGIILPPGTNAQLKNVAAVAVHANLPAFAKVGQTIDITVSSIGNAKSLRGGTLLMMPLKGADGRVYAMAQGDLLVSGLNASGSDGSSVTVNIPSVGSIPNGATVERVVQNPFLSGDSITLNLNRSDFTTANRLARAINETVGPGIAQPLDAVSIKVSAPGDPAQRVAFASMVENIIVQPGKAAARVIINSRTGTVVIGEKVRILPAAISHGSLVVTISQALQVSQPPALSGGSTAVTANSDVDVQMEGDRMFLLNTGITLQDVVDAVNRVGATPADLVSILQALKGAGALRAELIVI
ncbi:flagellar P-ring protein precursor FlgI [Thiogranum longum]|uniref:Flagellar P-ring protein n=2 Tax=Thiogranum longum TaxID=1537524 RepID=A0A4R1HAA9_9GAMM|nr:flagellar basal body P-ring protein FlgI [Thiogranum longum]TCK18864.1 flagellar P-ring protein precursor FlgI [Thiogranum longum]